MLGTVHNKNIIREKEEQMSQFAKEMKRARENPEIQRACGCEANGFCALKHESWSLRGSE